MQTHSKTAREKPLFFVGIQVTKRLDNYEQDTALGAYDKKYF